MEAKAYLEQARNINLQIDSKLEQVSALRRLATKASSALSPVPPSGTPNPHRLEETIAKMMDMEHEVDEAIDGLVEVEEQMGSIRDFQSASVVYALFIQGSQLLEEGWEVEDHSISDQTGGLWVQHP